MSEGKRRSFIEVLFHGDPFERFVVAIITSVAVLAAVVTLLQTDASARAAQFVGSLVDRLVALVVDDALVTVRAHYVDLAPLTDDAVVTVLERLGSRRPLEAAG